MGDRQLLRWAAANWFVIVAPSLALIGWLSARTAWSRAGVSLEAALIFDAVVTVPALYALCYGRRRPLRPVAVRMVALACLGIYLLGWIVPTDAQVLLPSLGWARNAGLAVLILVELRIMVGALRLVFRAGATSEQLTAQTGAPPLIAKLMLLEVRIWKRLWRLLRRD